MNSLRPSAATIAAGAGGQGIGSASGASTSIGLSGHDGTGALDLSDSTAGGASSALANSQASMHGSLDGGLNFNSVLLYNCATLSFQTQQFGLCLGYLNVILRNMDNVEGFLQVKTLFLLLQTLFELRQCEPA